MRMPEKGIKKRENKVRRASSSPEMRENCVERRDHYREGGKGESHGSQKMTRIAPVSSSKNLLSGGRLETDADVASSGRASRTDMSRQFSWTNKEGIMCAELRSPILLLGRRGAV